MYLVQISLFGSFYLYLIPVYERDKKLQIYNEFKIFICHLVGKLHKDFRGNNSYSNTF